MSELSHSAPRSCSRARRRGGGKRAIELFENLFSESGTRRRLRATWVRPVFSSGREVWNDLDCDIFRLHGPLIAHVVYVPAAYISEALACTVRFKRAVVVVHRERSVYHCDQTGTRMGVPTSLASGLEHVLGDVEVRVALYFCLEFPTAQWILAHQVEQAVGEGARWHRRQKIAACNTAPIRRTRRQGCERDDCDKHRCDEQWQDSCFFEVSQWIHCCSFLFGLFFLVGHKFRCPRISPGFAT